MKPISLSLPVALAMLSALLFPACNTDAPESTVEIQIDSTYFAMNPMDIPFDSSEMKMINKALGEYIEAHRRKGPRDPARYPLRHQGPLCLS